MSQRPKQFIRAAWLVLLLAGFAGTVALASRIGVSGFTWTKDRPKKTASHGSYRTLAAARNANAMPTAASVCISAVGTANARGPVDVHGTPHDYVEIRNLSNRPFNLTGCTLTDRASKANKWKFPPIILPPGGWLIAWASGQDRVDSLHTTQPSAAQRGNGWRAAREDYKDAAYRVWQSSFPADTNATLPASTSLRYTIPNEVSGSHSLWLYMRSDTSDTSRVICTVQDRRVALDLAPTNAYRFCHIMNPERSDGTWHLSTNSLDVTIDLAYGAVRVGRLVSICAEEPFGNGSQDLHVNFRINREGDFVGLFSPEGVPLDYVSTPEMSPGESYRRSTDRHSDFSIMPAFASVPHLAHPPRVTPPPGLQTGETKVEMESSDGRDAIRYTLDGSLPDESSPVYEAPIALNSNTVVRARSFRPGAAPSASTDSTYWFSKIGPLPVLSVTMEQDDMDDPEYGLFMTRQRRGIATERPCHLTLIEPDGKAVSARAGIRVQGRSTRTSQLKQNWRFTFREQFGEDSWPAPLFGTTGPEKTASFVALAGAHLAQQAVFAGANAAGLRTPRTKLVVMYVNTRPYGLYMLADDINNPQYLEQTFGHLDLSVFKMKTDTPVKWGATNAFDLAWSKLLSTPRKEVTTNMVSELIDLTMLTRFYAVVSYFGIGDSGQGYFVRDNRSADQRWSIILWDMEGAFFYPYNKPVFDIPDVVGRLFKALSRSQVYMSEIYYPEYQSLLNHTFDQASISAVVSEYMTNFEFYADEEWRAIENQHDLRAVNSTREAFMAEERKYMKKAAAYTRKRTDDLLGLLAREMGQTAVHQVAVNIAPGTPPLLVNGYPQTLTSHNGRYINGTPLRIVPVKAESSAPLRFEVNGVATTNTAMKVTVTEPLTISVSLP